MPINERQKMIPLIDGDILRYEIGFAAEAAFRHLRQDDEALPSFDFVENILLGRIGTILEEVDGEHPEIYLTEGKTFREDIAKTREYKGNRSSMKPWHYNNLSVYLRDLMNATTVEGIEADDALTLRHLKDPEEPTIICTRDKDLKQVPGWFYSWELGNQPAFGPKLLDVEGSLELIKGNPTKLKGTGLAFFYSQILTGDTADNIPGLPRYGAVKAYNLLADEPRKEWLKIVIDHYQDVHGKHWEEILLEQGRLLWMTRRMKGTSPELWEIGMEE